VVVVSVDRLHPDDLAALADLVAERVLDGLADAGRLATRRAQDGEAFLTAAEVAVRFGVSRDYVYEHADALGALLGDGQRPRLRFDPAKVAAALSSRAAGEESPASEAAAPRRSRRQTPARTATGVELLPIRGKAA
jgi:hypothetical protein